MNAAENESRITDLVGQLSASMAPNAPSEEVIDRLCRAYHGDYEWDRERGGQRDVWRDWEMKRMRRALDASGLTAVPR